VKEIVSGERETAPNPHDLYFELRADYVHAQNLTDNEPLPRIPPLRFGAAVGYQGPALGARVALLRVQRQNRVSDFETTTPGYTSLDADISYTFTRGPVTYDLYLRGTNLLDQTERDHTSFLKDVLPLPGRGVMVGLRASF
jgi:iron complex outermembrane receptor protein